MRASLRLYCCPQLGCPKIGKDGEVCPSHSKPLEGVIYDMREIQFEEKRASEADLGERIMETAEKVARAFRPPGA